MDEISFEQKATNLIEVVKTEFKTASKDEVQHELAELLSMIHDLRKTGDFNLITPLEIAVRSLLKDPPGLKFSSEIRENIDHKLRDVRSLYGRLKGIIFSDTPPARVILGLGVLLYLMIPILSVLLTFLLGRTDAPIEIAGIPLKMLLLVSIAGAVGSIVSIMIRISDFSESKNTDPAVLFFTGFFKPVIGASFALFLFAVLKAGLIPISVDTKIEQYFFMALSFVSGFSERLAQDIISKVEGQVGGQK